MIQNIIFDIGNVLLNFNPYEYLNQKLGGEERVKAIYENIFAGEEWVRLDAGTITAREATAAFTARSPEYATAIRDVMANWHEMLTPIDGTVALLAPLKKQGCSLFYLSNFHELAAACIMDRYAFFSIFSGGVFSFAEKLIKPDRRIYSRLLDRYGLSAGDCVFIDDSPVNVDMAVKAGMAGIVFKNPH
ncbi:MAG: HAD family phosphatase, partial [Oscillospiraceae bacterium]|nr:HAD family phosphatase [Oscillospiraceae bacterium]